MREISTTGAVRSASPNPFLVEYGKQFNDATYANDEATKQIVVDASHLKQPNGLMRHAYDEARAQTWADPVTGVAPEYWCRAIGWFGMATIDILGIIPATPPRRRAQLITIIRDLVAGFARYQDPTTGPLPGPGQSSSRPARVGDGSVVRAAAAPLRGDTAAVPRRR